MNQPNTLLDSFAARILALEMKVQVLEAAVRIHEAERPKQPKVKRETERPSTKSA